jgi:hypothetical protein
LSLPEVQGVLALPVDRAADELQKFVTLAAREVSTENQGRTQSVISHPGQPGHLRAVNNMNRILQTDGHADTSDEDEEEEDEDDDLDDDLDLDKDDLEKDEEEDAGQDEVC